MGHLTVESEADALLLCPSKDQTHTQAAHSVLFISAFKGRINREEEKETKRNGWKTGTPKCRLLVLWEPLKALGSPSGVKLLALIWLYLLCYFNNKENNLCFIYKHSVEKWQCFTFSNSCFAHLTQTCFWNVSMQMLILLPYIQDVISK